MAEAHQAVAFQFVVTDEGISVHLDREAVKKALKSVLGAYRRRYFRTRNAILNGVFPATPVSLVFILAVTAVLYRWFELDPTLGAPEKLGRYVDHSCRCIR